MSSSLERLAEKCEKYNIVIYPHMRYEEPMLLLIEKMEELEHFAECVARYAGNNCDDYLAEKAREVLPKEASE